MPPPKLETEEAPDSLRPIHEAAKTPPTPKLVGSDRPYHYLGSAIWYTRIGHSMGEAMLELLEPA